jgi:transposase
MARNRHLALSVADAGMSRLIGCLAYKVDWRERRIVQCDPWFPSSQICCMCGALHPKMRKLSVRTLTCECDNVMDRDRNAAVNIHKWYPEERENRGRNGPMRVKIRDQELAPVPVNEARISAYEKQ